MIVMQTFVCESCGHGWTAEIHDDLTATNSYQLRCSICGKIGEPRGTSWVRIPLRAKP